MPFGIISRMGQGMRQVKGVGDRSTGSSTFGGIWGVPLSTGTYRAYMCYSAATRPYCKITLSRLAIIIVMNAPCFKHKK